MRTNTEAASQKSGFHTHFKTWVSNFETENGGSLSSELWRELMAEDVAHPYKEYPLSCVPLPAIDSGAATGSGDMGIPEEELGEFNTSLYTFQSV